MRGPRVHLGKPRGRMYDVFRLTTPCRIAAGCPASRPSPPLLETKEEQQLLASCLLVALLVLWCHIKNAIVQIMSNDLSISHDATSRLDRSLAKKHKNPHQ
eukprot:1988981-Amphidinium_carterae.1